MLEYSSNLHSFAKTLTPCFSQDFFVSSSRSLFCPVINKLQPSFESCLAIAAPMPELAPVTSAYLSLKFIIMLVLRSTDNGQQTTVFDHVVVLVFSYFERKFKIIFKRLYKNDKIFY